MGPNVQFVRAYIFDFCSFFSVAYITLNKLHTVLQRVSIACYAERCISYSKSVLLSVRLSVTRWH